MKGKVQFLFSRAFALVLAILILLPILNVRIFATGEIIIPENLAMGKNVTANNHYQKNHPMTMAVDGSTYTHWRSMSTCEDGFIYLIVPFEAAVDIGLIRVILYEQSVMNSVKLQYTADPNPSAESPWEDIKAFAREELSPEMTIKFDTVRATGVRFYAEVSAHPAGASSGSLNSTQRLSKTSFVTLSLPPSIGSSRSG